MPTTIRLLHGSDHIIQEPDYSLGKTNNDYGKGFYCTEDLEMAREWACKENKDGFVNEYDLDIQSLQVLNLLDGNHTILNWIAVLLANRAFNLQDEIASDARDYIIEHYAVELTGYDVVIGYRADDSYFSYAQSFVSNTLPLRRLDKALRLGSLGIQTVLISKRAFKQIKFIRATSVDKETYYSKFLVRDTEARDTYRREIKKGRSYKDDIFVVDIIRQELKNDDPRIQRIFSY